MADTPKKKRPYNRKPKFDADGNPLPVPPKAVPKGKKRQRDDTADLTSPEAPRHKIKIPGKGQAMDKDTDYVGDDSTVPKLKTPKITIKTGLSKPAGAPIIKMKHQGKAPPRPPGVGYDSEAESAEDDPAIESQFVLRMQPGPDCDLLREAIEQKTIGKSQAAGGPGVYFRFLDREGRRTVVSIKGRLYAATMVDLPCVVESMKSWNKKDWVKTADICQMLLVLGQVKDDEEAKKFPLPREIDPETHQYAHGLTPPMHWVRKRRFRPRTNYKRIEEIERAVEELLARDAECEAMGGKVEFEVMDEAEYEREEAGLQSAPEDEEMGDAEPVEYAASMADVDAEGEDDSDDDEMAKRMAEALGGGDGDDLFGEPDEPAATSHDVAMHALGEAATSATAETPGSTSNAETESADDDDEDAESEEEIDDDKLAAQQELLQQKEEIADLEKEIETARAQYNNTTNILFRQRTLQKIQSLQNDLNMKKAAIGEEVDD
jgi:transcription initiation factor TFIID subunit 7